MLWPYYTNLTNQYIHLILFNFCLNSENKVITSILFNHLDELLSLINLYIENRLNHLLFLKLNIT